MIQVKYNNTKYKLYRKSDGDAGYDICANENMIIPAGESFAVSTGVYLSMPRDIYCRIAPRSGYALRQKINVHGGVVDSNYRGEVKVILFNHGREQFGVRKGQRIATLIFTQLSTYNLKEVETLDQSDRNEKGFGSSGNF